MSPAGLQKLYVESLFQYKTAGVYFSFPIHCLYYIFSYESMQIPKFIKTVLVSVPIGVTFFDVVGYIARVDGKMKHLT
jgi:hypothetical protein